MAREIMTIDDVAAFYNVPREKLGYYERAVFEYNKDIKNAKITYIPLNMAMTTSELIDYKESLVETLKTDELALERIKLHVQNQRKMIDLVTKQIEESRYKSESVEEKQPL